jgi:hypothetical protein
MYLLIIPIVWTTLIYLLLFMELVMLPPFTNPMWRCSVGAVWLLTGKSLFYFILQQVNRRSNLKVPKEMLHSCHFCSFYTVLLGTVTDVGSRDWCASKSVIVSHTLLAVGLSFGFFTQHNLASFQTTSDRWGASSLPGLSGLTLCVTTRSKKLVKAMCPSGTSSAKIWQSLFGHQVFNVTYMRLTSNKVIPNA